VKDFAQLYTRLDETTRTNEKVAALEAYFRSAAAKDAAWALAFLTGHRLRRAVKTSHMRQWTAEAAGLPLWMVEECYDTVGDLAETLALLLPAAQQSSSLPLSDLVEQRLQPLAKATEQEQQRILCQTWDELDHTQRYLWHKLLTGAFRVGVARGLVVRALASIAGVSAAVMTHRLMGDWQPTAQDYEALLSGESQQDSPAKPYPFYLASPLEEDLSSLGPVEDWQLEWKWDGIRAQLIRRAGTTVIWSRGEEIITPAFPEIVKASAALPDGTVLDGELLAWQEGNPLPFSALQKRLNRKTASANLQREVPIAFMAYDLLELAGTDQRSQPLAERRRAMEKLIAQQPLHQREVPPQGELFAEFLPPPSAQLLYSSALLNASSWEEVQQLQHQSRVKSVEGLMLKKRGSSYAVGRTRGFWWKWKVQPYHIDAVLIAAQPGHGRRATLFTDYTFGVWQGTDLVPVAKAYSGLTDKEINEVDAFVRSHTRGKFGPVRSVEAELVFELAFEGIAPSTRHKSGIALRFPRISRWRKDKPKEEADTLEALQSLAKSESKAPHRPAASRAM
jgi:DNA ligase 1